MSIESMSKALQVQGLTASEKLCLIGIANHDGDGGAWPSQATLARYVGCSDRNVRYLITRLVELGYLTVEVNAGGTDKTPSGLRPNRYHINFNPPTGVQPTSTQGGSPLPPRVEAHCTPGWKPTSTEPSYEPSKETPVKPRTAAPLVSHSSIPSELGGDPDKEEEDKNKLAPSRQIVGLFMDEWFTVVEQRPDYAMIRRLPHKISAYKWLNEQFFKPLHGDPVSVSEVSQYVMTFMRMVRYDEITPRAEYTAWQCFVAHIAKLNDNAGMATLDPSKITIL